jgi:hypothetical protein
VGQRKNPGERYWRRAASRSKARTARHGSDLEKAMILDTPLVPSDSRMTSPASQFSSSPMILAHRRAPHGIRWLPIRRRPGPRPRRLAANKEEHRGPDRELSRPRGLKMREDVPVARADRHSVRGCGFLPHSAKRASYAGSIYRSLNRAFSNDCPAVAPKKSGPIPSGSLPPIALNEAPCCDGACANCAARF